MGVFLLLQRQAFATPADGRKTDREAINAVLTRQQRMDTAACGRVSGGIWRRRN